MYMMQEYAVCLGVVLVMATLLLMISGIGYALKLTGALFVRSARTGACHDAFASLAVRLKRGSLVIVEAVPLAATQLPL
jgi:hypothetical protein